MKQIVVINGHPNPNSFCRGLSEAYVEGAVGAGLNISQINIGDLDFDPILKRGFQERMELEPDLVLATNKILAADHLVWVYPMWWYSMPAITKGFIDRVFLPGTMFNSRGLKFPERLLKGKTGHIIVTADTPRWYDFLFMKSPSINQLKKGTLEFCGVSPVKTTYISPIKGSSDTFREKQLSKVKRLGDKGV